MLDRIKKFIGERWSEASTKRALSILAGIIGYNIAPEYVDIIAQLVGVALVYFGVTPDKKKTPGELALEKKAAKEAELAELEERVAELKAE